MKNALLLLLFAFYSISSVFSQQSLVKSVYFGGGSYYIDQVQVEEIREFIQSIPNIEHYQIMVSSHTDNIGSMEYNRRLSKMRSRSVMYQLQQNNISPEKILIQDNGEENPYFDNTTLKGRLSNRRVDIILTPLLL